MTLLGAKSRERKCNMRAACHHQSDLNYCWTSALIDKHKKVSACFTQTKQKKKKRWKGNTFKVSRRAADFLSSSSQFTCSLSFLAFTNRSVALWMERECKKKVHRCISKFTFGEKSLQAIYVPSVAREFLLCKIAHPLLFVFSLAPPPAVSCLHPFHLFWPLSLVSVRAALAAADFSERENTRVSYTWKCTCSPNKMMGSPNSLRRAFTTSSLVDTGIALAFFCCSSWSISWLNLSCDASVSAEKGSTATASAFTLSDCL